MRVQVCHAVRLYVHVVTTLCAHVEASRIVCECVDAEAGVVDAQRLFFLCGPGPACLSSINLFLVFVSGVCLLRYVIEQWLSELVTYRIWAQDIGCCCGALCSPSARTSSSFVLSSVRFLLT